MWIVRWLLVAALFGPCVGCGSMLELAGGYTNALSSNPGRAGPAFNASLGGGAENAGLGLSSRYKQGENARQWALGAHAYGFELNRSVAPFGRLGVDLLEIERVDGEKFVSAFSPYLDLGLILNGSDPRSATGLSLSTSIEYDLRFHDLDNELYYFFLVGIASASKGSGWRPGGG